MSLIPDGEETTTTETQEQVTTEQQTTTTENPEAKYLFADGIGGEGDAPDWFKSDKYKTVSAQAEAYNELEGKFGSFVGAPKEGKYEIEGLDFEQNPLMGVVAEWGLEQQLSNDGLGALVGRVNKLATQQVEQDKDAALKALGDNADKRIGDLAQWGKNNLSEDEFVQFQGLAQTAGHVEMLEKLIGMTKNSKLVTEEPQVTNSADVEAELTKMQLATNDKGQRLMEVDPKYRAKVNTKMQEFYK